MHEVLRPQLQIQLRNILFVPGSTVSRCQHQNRVAQSLLLLEILRLPKKICRLLLKNILVDSHALELIRGFLRLLVPKMVV